MRGTLLAQLHMLQAQPAAEGSHADTCRTRKLIFVIAFHILRSLSIVSAKLQKIQQISKRTRPKFNSRTKVFPNKNKVKEFLLDSMQKILTSLTT